MRAIFTCSLMASLVFAAACTAPNPDYIGPNAGQPDMGTDAGSDAGSDAGQPCPVKPMDKAMVSSFSFHPDAVRCPTMVALPADGQATNSAAAYWVAYDALRPITFVSQPFAVAASAPWTFQPGNKTADYLANEWHLLDRASVTSVYSALTAGGSQVGFNRTLIDVVARTVKVEKCLDKGTSGYCYPWQ